MSHYDIENSIHKLSNLGINTDDLYKDYYKIPLENTELSKIERKVPEKVKVLKKHTLIIDSRQRDYSIYQTPNKYSITLTEIRKNVEQLELIAAMMPKTEYNVNTENNLILLTINGITEQLLLTVGQYLIGSNVDGNINYSSNGGLPKFGLIAELKRILNLHSLSQNKFNVLLATIPPDQKGTGINASILNRVVIMNDSVDFSIDFTNSNYLSGSPFRLLGFPKQNIISESISIYGSDKLGSCSIENLNSGTTFIIHKAIASIYDYDLIDDPKYSILEIEFGNKSADRTESIDLATNQKFCMVIYDNNEPDNIQTFNSNNTGYLQINFNRNPGRLKAMKGADFDKKILKFDPPITLETLKISFYKYDNTLYDFHNREHMLVFELDSAIYDPRYKY